MTSKEYFDSLRLKMDDYVHFVYKITKKFLRDELYGSTSQLRRSSLSVILNFIEGFARQRQLVKLNFWEISYGSLKESKYLIYSAFKESYIEKLEYEIALGYSEEIGAMLWKMFESVRRKT